MTLLKRLLPATKRNTHALRNALKMYAPVNNRRYNNANYSKLKNYARAFLKNHQFELKFLNSANNIISKLEYIQIRERLNEKQKLLHENHRERLNLIRKEYNKRIKEIHNLKVENFTNNNFKK